MKNITITMEDDVARWAKIHAAKQDISLSRMLGKLLAEQMNKEMRMEQARHRFFSKSPSPLQPEGANYPKREILHGR